MPVQSHIVCNRRSKRGSFSLVLKIDARPFIDSYITYLHFDDIVSTALRAVDTQIIIESGIFSNECTVA